MRRKKDKEPDHPEPVDQPPVEITAPVPPDPIVRAILVGPSSQARTHLSDLISTTPRFEVVHRFDRADDAIATVNALPARRGVAVLIDTKLTGAHDAGWVIRRLRERYPVIRLFAYGEEPDEPLLEHAALAGVDEVLMVGGPESDEEVLVAFTRQFDLTPLSEQVVAQEQFPAQTPLPAVPAPPVSEELPAHVPPLAVAEPPVSEAFPAEPPPPAVPAAEIAEDIPLERPTIEAPIAADAQPRAHEVPTSDDPAAIDAVSPPDRDPATRKRSRFLRRSGGASRDVEQDASEESAAVRNLERELAGVQRLSTEAARLAATHGAPPSTRATQRRLGNKETEEPAE
jgi:DNA-binding NarL/FixJ family response regulator